MNTNLMTHLIQHLKHIVLIFKQYYMYLYTLFYLYVFQKNTNNITQTPLPGPRLVETQLSSSK